MDGVDREIKLRNLLAPVRLSADRRAEALDYLRSDPATYLPLFCKLANAELAPIREKAAGVVNDFLVQRISLEIDLLALRHLPYRNPGLAPGAVVVTERVLHDIEGSEDVAPDAAAEFLNNLSERLAMAGDRTGALRHAQQSVERFRKLAAASPSMAPSFVRALNTLARRFEESGEPISAWETANDAVQISEMLPPAPDRSNVLLLAQSLTNRGNRSFHAENYAVALLDGSRSEELLNAVAMDRQDVHINLALARLLKANAGIRLGRFREALPDAEAAYKAFEPLAAMKPVQNWDFLLAAGNAFATVLARLGETSRAKQLIYGALTHFGALAHEHPKAYAAEYVAYLVTQSASFGESGDRVSAVDFAERAVAQARRFRRDIGDFASALEGQAQNNLFLRLYDLGDFVAARNVARSAVRAFDKVPKHHGPLEQEAIRALRNLAESLRMSGGKPADLRQALMIATKATAAALERAVSNQPADLQLLAHCHSSQSLCEWELGRLEDALASELRSLAIRRQLFTMAPDSYRRELAYSLRLLGTYHLDLGHMRDALRYIAESLREYRTLAQHSDEDIARYVAEAFHIRSRILVEFQRTKPALVSVRAALGLLLAGFRRQGDGFRPKIVELLPLYVKLSAELNQELDAEIVAWVVQERARHEGGSVSVTKSTSGK
jgi:hypothetical protein